MPPARREWTGDDLLALANLGYEGEPDVFTLPIKKPADRSLTDDQRQHNWAQAYARARAEQAWPRMTCSTGWPRTTGSA